MRKISNSNGFTIIELLTSFSLAMVVMVFIFNIVLLLKNSYILNSAKSELIVNQSLLSVELNSDFEEGKLFSFRPDISCGEYCYTVKLVINSEEITKMLLIDKENNTIKYGSYIYILESTESIGDINVCKNETNANGKMNSYIVIDIPIKSSIVEDTNFGVKVIYPYNDDGTEITGIDGC